MSFVPEVFAHHYIGHIHSTEFRLKAGLILKSGKHTQDHMGIVAQGDAVLKSPHGDIVLTGPATAELKAGIEYQLQTLTDVVWFCIHRGKR